MKSRTEVRGKSGPAAVKNAGIGLADTSHWQRSRAMKAKEILIQVVGLVLLGIGAVVLVILEIAFAAVPVALFIWFVYLILKYLGVFG